MEILAFLLIAILLTSASFGGICISIIKLRKIKEGAKGARVPWIILLVVCGIYLAFVIAAIVFLFILAASLAINGMQFMKKFVLALCLIIGLGLASSCALAAYTWHLYKTSSLTAFISNEKLQAGDYEAFNLCPDLPSLRSFLYSF